MSTDAELLQRYTREKSEAAFAKLVQRHLSLVYSSALRQLGGDTHLAQDVAQTVFTALARKATALSGHATLAGWLYLSTHHAAAQAVRSNRRREVREQEAHAMHDALESSTRGTDWDRVRPVLDNAMRDLGETDREAVLLRFFEQRPFVEIGAALNLSEDAARMRVERALDKLHALLARRGITSTTAALTAALADQAMVAAPAGLAASVTSVAVYQSAAATATGFFMNTMTTVTGAIAAVAIGVGIYHVGQTRRAEMAAADIGRERDSLRAQLRDAQQQAKRADQQLALARGEAASKLANQPAVETPKAKQGVLGISSPLPEGTPLGIARNISDPPDRKRKMMGDALDTSYAAFFRQLGFTPSQREQFKTLFIESKLRLDETLAAAMAQGSVPDRSSFQSWARQNTAEMQAKQRSLFGEAVFQSLQHYEATGALRAVTNDLATALFHTETPLTVAQADQVVEIMAGHTGNAEGRFDLLAMDNAAVLAQVQGVLSAPQVEALRVVAENAQAVQRMMAERNKPPQSSRPQP